MSTLTTQALLLLHFYKAGITFLMWVFSECCATAWIFDSNGFLKCHLSIRFQEKVAQKLFYHNWGLTGITIWVQLKRFSICPTHTHTYGRIGMLQKNREKKCFYVVVLGTRRVFPQKRHGNKFCMCCRTGETITIKKVKCIERTILSQTIHHFWLRKNINDTYSF